MRLPLSFSSLFQLNVYLNVVLHEIEWLCLPVPTVPSVPTVPRSCYMGIGMGIGIGSRPPGPHGPPVLLIPAAIHTPVHHFYSIPTPDSTKRFVKNNAIQTGWVHKNFVDWTQLSLPFNRTCERLKGNRSLHSC